MPGDLDDHAQARVGTTINEKYRLERRIGSGGMASVFEAVHRNGHRVAIKMLHPHLSCARELRARFLREGYVANKVEHSGAVRVLDDDTAQDGSVFLVMELLAGQTLDSRWEASGRRLPPREACELAYQLLDVLAAAHAKGVVHRDIKPENLFLTTGGVLKVLDFGIARLRETSTVDAATRTGRMIGTPAFMPPEQALGRSKHMDGQTDLWAVGATMFTLVSGHFVHEAETMEEMLVRAGSQAARSVASVAHGLPPAIAAVIDRALAFRREERWPSARAMEMALENAYRSAFGASVPGARVQSPPGLDLAAPGDPSLMASPAVQPTVHDPSAGAMGFSLRAPLAPTAPVTTAGSATQMAPWAARPGAAQGISTTAGTARRSGGIADERRRQAPSPGAARGAMWTLLGVLAIAVLLGALLVVLRNRRVASPSGGAAAAPGAVATLGAPPGSDPVPPASVTAEVLTPLPGTAPVTLPLSNPPAPARPSPALGPATQMTRPAAPVPQPAVRPAEKVDCDPPYLIDSAGHRQYKPECLK
jgi:eukaryotic-like serine/threonine-protein kinase